MSFIRSLVFNLAFYIWTAVCCIGLSWSLAMSRGRILGTVKWYMRTIAFLERTVLGLHYEVRGRANLPADGCYVVAAKHQSAWETLKLHLIFDDPAIVLKRELVDIPIWGAFARAIGAIPVVRGAGGKSMAALVTAAEPISRTGRPIVIFPQGTRVAPGAWKTYRAGVGVLYEELSLPVVPMALNSGVFWPRHRFRKQPGTIVIEFLPPLMPGLDRDEMMAELQNRLESATDRLVTAAGGPPTKAPSPDATAKRRPSGRQHRLVH